MSAVVDLARPEVKLYPRWEGHGDLMIVVRDGVVYVRADQLEQLAGIPPWSTGETLLDDVWPLTLDGRAYYVADVAIARCEAADTPLASEFLVWLTEQFDVLLVDEQLDEAQWVPGFIGSYPVQVAARILDADPGIRIGRTGLFSHMHALGWIARADVGGDWLITDLARRHGWLTIRNVVVPAASKVLQRPYPQVYVTPAGLAELFASLGGLGGAPRPDTPASPTLFD